MSSLLDGAAAVVAAYACNAVWQAPVIALAAWLSVRLGRPVPKVAHGVWASALVLCALAPVTGVLSTARVTSREGHFKQHAERWERQQVSPDLPTTIDMRQDPAVTRESPFPYSTRRRNAVTPGDRLELLLKPRDAQAIAGVYLLMLIVALIRAWRSAWAARRIRYSAEQLQDDEPLQRAVQARCMACAIAKVPVLASERVTGPVIAGTLKPVLLVSPNLLSATDDMCAAIAAHEVAHLRRRDPLTNALLELVSVPVRFHPAVSWVVRRVRQTREMACDVEAADAVHSRTAYAHTLVHLAGRPQFAEGAEMSGIGMFHKEGNMEERVQSVLSGADGADAGSMGQNLWRYAGCGALALATVACVLAYHVEPMMAAAAEHPVRNATEPLPQASEALPPAAPAGTAESRSPVPAPVPVPLPKVQENSSPAPRASSGQISNEQKVEIDAQMEQLRKELRELKVQIDSGQIQKELAAAQKQMAEARKELNSKATRQAIEEARRAMQDPEVRRQIAEAQRMAMHAGSITEAQRKQMEKMRQEVERQVRPEALAAAQRAMEEQRKHWPEVEKAIANAQREIAEARLAAPKLPEENVPALPDTSGAVEVPAATMAGMRKQYVRPKYPAYAKERKIAGTVVLDVQIDRTGHVVSAHPISFPDSLLAEAATASVLQWTYEPYQVGGEAVPVHTTVQVVFSVPQP